MIIEINLYFDSTAIAVTHCKRSRKQKLYLNYISFLQGLTVIFVKKLCSINVFITFIKFNCGDGLTGKGSDI